MDHLLLLLLLLLRASLLLAATSTDFNPSYFLNCGSKFNIITNDIIPRDFVTDFNFVSGNNSFPLTNTSCTDPFFSLYSTARVFNGTASYTFPLDSPGVLGLRLHFLPFSTDDRDLSAALFRVTAQRFVLLDNFSVASSAAPVIKEYFLWFDSTASTNLELTFLPASSSFAFVSAVEVFTTPSYLFVSSPLADLSNQAVETVYRINVGGVKVTPVNDTMWRTWIPDDDYLFNKNTASVNCTSTRAINYEKTNVNRPQFFDFRRWSSHRCSGDPSYKTVCSRGRSFRATNVIVAPESIYSTARTMNIPEDMRIGNPDFNFNVTWNFKVDAGYNYLVRAHFCDFISQAFQYDPIIFNLYAANQSTEINSRDHTDSPSVPFYWDTRAEKLHSGWINISIDRSNLNRAENANAYLNGLEIFKFKDALDHSSDSSKRSVSVAVIASASVGSAVLLSLVVFLLVLLACKRRRRSKSPPQLPKEAWSPYRRGTTPRGNSVDLPSEPTEETTAVTASPRVNLDLNIPLLEIRAATNDFDESLLVGSGGFGKVYKGILGDGTNVAVKRAMPGSRQGYPEFQTEILVLSKIRHRHLVSLIGYCEEQSERILVYEYMEKGPLRNYLYGSDDKPCLSWKQRLEICIGAARGLHYLHTGARTIIHRDVKSTNILLDKTYLAKVSDFGISRLGPSTGETHVTTAVKGTFGYFDPEYFKTQQLTEKSDVYSFGVMLFEVLCARPVIDRSLSEEQMNVAEWALHWQRSGQLEKIIDQRLAGNINTNSLKKFGETAEKCLADYGDDRPSFADVLWNLEYALELHVTELKREPHEDSGAVELQISVAATRLVDLATVANVEEENNWRTRSIMPLDASGSTVFSQLDSSEGR